MSSSIEEPRDHSPSPFLRVEALTHSLAPHFEALRAIRTRAALERSALWASMRDEVERLLDAVETGHHRKARPRPLAGLRAAAWNICRGIRFDEVHDTLAHHPALRDADVIFLSEVDDGMGRSGNRHVSRALAESLGASYAFCPSYLALEDDWGENPERAPSTLALAGVAVLSRLPIRRARNLDLPELRDKFSSSEKRLGRKRALWVEVELDDGPLGLACCHLDSNASPAQRARQMNAILDHVDAASLPRVLLGGDLNSTTYDASGTWALLRDLAHKLFVTGFRASIDNYMTPERLYETPLFDALARRGFSVEGFNDRAAGTRVYDLDNAYEIEKVRSSMGRVLAWYLRRRLRPWKGRCAARLDWFAGRGVSPGEAGVVDVRDEQGRPPSDHAAIWVTLS